MLIELILILSIIEKKAFLKIFFHKSTYEYFHITPTHEFHLRAGQYFSSIQYNAH